MAATILDQTKNAVTNANDVNFDRDRMGRFLSAQVALYSLGPDDYADIKRLPPACTTAGELAAYLATLHTRIGTQAAASKTNGDLRTYKNLIIAIHAILGAIAELGDARTYHAHADAVLIHACAHVPPNLANEAQKLWMSTFGTRTSRIRVVIIMILSLFVSQADVAVAADAAATAPIIAGMSQEAAQASRASAATAAMIITKASRAAVQSSAQPGEAASEGGTQQRV